MATVTEGMAVPPAGANGVHERGADRARAEAWGVEAPAPAAVDEAIASLM